MPLYQFEGHRTQLPAWAERKGEDGLIEYQLKNNRDSIDGLPGLDWAQPDPLSKTTNPEPESLGDKA